MSRFVSLLAIVLTGQFMAVLDASVVNVAAPSIHADLHATGAGLQLVIAGYVITSAVGLVTGARLGDILGHRRMFLAGLVLFTLASLGCGLATSTGMLVALRFVENVYKSALFGLQRQVWTNGVNAALATLRGVGAVLILAEVSPTIEAFFLWQALISLLSVVFLGLGVHRTLPHGPRRARFSLTTLLPVWRYAGGLTGITLLALLLTQVDKLLLSRLLSLQDFGYYSLASLVAGVLYLLITPITTAMFPRMVELVSVHDNATLGSIYHRGAELVSVLTAPVAMLLALHGEGALFAWSGSLELATAAAPILAALAIGTFINGLMHMPYQLQLAHGWTSLILKTNVVAVALLVPAILWVVPRYGAVGAAWIWIALNTGYVLLNVGLMHRRILPSEKWDWYGQDVLMPALGATATLLLLSGLRPPHLSDRVAWLAYLSVALGTATACAALTVRDYRIYVFRWIRRATNAHTT